MKKTILLIAAFVSIAMSISALTYDEAFETIRQLPNMKGVERTMITGNNDFTSIGITDAQLIVWSGETPVDKETEVYGNVLYRIMGDLPVDQMIQSRIGNSDILAIFATPTSADTNRILILTDSAGAGFTGALIGNIDNTSLSALSNAILIPRPEGGTAIYLNALNF